MGHFSLSNKPASPIPRAVELGIRMRKKAPPPAALKAYCCPYWDLWNITDDGGDDFSEDRELYFDAGPDSEFCGQCLQWVYLGAQDAPDSVGAEPEIEMSFAPDCRGLIVKVIGQTPPPHQWLLTFQAKLGGRNFGCPTGFTIADEHLVLGECFEFSGDGGPGTAGPTSWKYPVAQDWEVVITYIHSFSGTFAWNPQWNPFPHPFGDTNYVEDTNELGQPRLTITNVWSGNSYPEDDFIGLTTAPTINGVDVANCINGANNATLQTP